MLGLIELQFMPTKMNELKKYIAVIVPHVIITLTIVYMKLTLTMVTLCLYDTSWYLCQVTPSIVPLTTKEILHLRSIQDIAVYRMLNKLCLKHLKLH